MIDSTNEEGEEEEETIINEYDESTVKGHDIYDDEEEEYDDLINNKDGDGMQGGEYVKFYEQYLYSLLPAIYKEYDSNKENNVLQEFLKIIASQAAVIRKDIDGLLNNFFINSSEEWVIPYIADLIAAKVVPNSSLNSRLEVQNTIRWRKLKGTQTGLVDLLRNTINRNAKVKEAFRYCSSSSHLAYISSDIVVNKPHNFVDLHDQNTLSNIDTENDSTPHTIDVRQPTQTNGWYNIKNILLFMPQLNTYHISHVQAEREDDRLRYYFSNLVQKHYSSSSSSSPSSPSYPDSNHFPLYDLDEGVKITGTAFAQDPFKYFGKRRGMSIKVDNILAACPNAPIFLPVEQKHNNPLENRVTIKITKGETNRGYGKSKNDYNYSHQTSYDSDNNNSDSTNAGNPDFISLHKTEGIRILEPRKFTTYDKPSSFIIRLYCYSEKHGPIEIAHYNTSKMSYRILPRSRLKKMSSGTILLSIEVASKIIVTAAEFPETVIAIRDSRPENLVQDSVLGKYRNALYVYLPSILVNSGDKKYFFVDRDGSTFEVEMNNDRYDMRSFQSGLAGTNNKNPHTRIASSSQVYPARELTYSMRPLHNFGELNRFAGIKAIDSRRYGKKPFEIEAIAINNDLRQAWKIGKLEINGGDGGDSGDGRSLSYVNEEEVWIRWKMSLEDAQYRAGNSYNEYYYLPACHFKAARLDLENSLEDSLNVEDIVKSVLPEGIMPEYSLEEKIGTYRIDQVSNERVGADDNNNNYNSRKSSTSNTYEYEVKIIIKNEYSEHSEYLANELKNSLEKKQEFVNEGKLMLRVSKKDAINQGDFFPLCEIILTNSFGRSVLVYLPELRFDNENKTHDLYIAEDGSTSHKQDLLIPARKSAGQIIPIANRYPLQHRIPVYVNLADWQSVGTNAIHSGELAIDPENGRFAFSREDDGINTEGIDWNNNNNNATTTNSQPMHITTDYNYAFSHDIGAGAFDRKASLKKKPTKWVSKNRHTYHNDAFPSKTFQTIADALASAEDGDVIQIEDNGIYDEGADINKITLPFEVRFITLQAANLTMPAIKVNEMLKLDSSNSVKRLTFNGILIVGGPLILPAEKFDKIVLISCTLNPGNYYNYHHHDDDSNQIGSFGIKILQQEKQEVMEQEQQYDGATVVTPTTTTTTTTTTTNLKNANNGYTTQQSNSPSLKEVSLIKSISGGIIVDNSVSLIGLEDSIVHNPGGPAISVKDTNKKEEEEDPMLKLEAKRSTILGKYRDDGYILKLEDICCSDCILMDKMDVILNKEEREDRTDNDKASCTSSLRYTTYEEGSKFENIRKGKIAIVECTVDRPIFISTAFGHPAYLHLDRLTSKSILEGAENTLEMGAFNRSYKPLRMRNLNLRLQEFLPLGIKSGVIYLY